MEKCLTKKLLYTEVSACLVEHPECGFAHKFGFSMFCGHPDHTQFHAHVINGMTQKEVFERHAMLKQKRRDEFVAGLDEESRRFFCHKTDFHGQPLVGSDHL
ncbi:MAG: hypothetical protein PHY09_16960 [Desulfuromonadaceae bacterium]|nr:hypothetical protein [Desulfuromonadaceae bacterium]MDD5106450.1 hypothetical protein [Desulfuromonadaceae bacterium]